MVIMKIAAKYKLCPLKETRFRVLLVKECTGSIDISEMVELNALSKERSRLLSSHPKIKESLAIAAMQSRKLRRLAKRLEDKIDRCVKSKLET